MASDPRPHKPASSWLLLWIVMAVVVFFGPLIWVVVRSWPR